MSRYAHLTKTRRVLLLASWMARPNGISRDRAQYLLGIKDKTLRRWLDDIDQVCDVVERRDPLRVQAGIGASIREEYAFAGDTNQPESET